jgi:carboxylesterase
MDGCDTASFTLGAENSRAAVVLLHGFTGSPWDVRPLGESLAARGYRVLGPRLPGHGTTPEAMLYVSHLDWERCAEDTLASLKDFPRVFVAGLSMGALLSLLLAARFPARVSALALIAPAIALQSRGARLLKMMRLLRAHPMDKVWLTKSSSDIEDEQSKASVPLLPRYPASRLRDVFTLQTLASRAVPMVRCPSMVAVSENDHVIDVRAARALAGKLPQARLLMLHRGFHIIPRDLERARLATEVGAFFDAT